MRPKKFTACPYLYGQATKRIHCVDNCFVKFMNSNEKKRFYIKRCIGEHRKCNIYKAIDERRRSKGGGDSE